MIVFLTIRPCIETCLQLDAGKQFHFRNHAEYPYCFIYINVLRRNKHRNV